MPDLEREGVTVVHPPVGYRETPTIAIDTDLLCAARSRHRAYATVVVDMHTDAALRRAHATPGDTTLATHRSVLSALPTTT
jgi:hypothetical protein